MYSTKIQKVREGIERNRIRLDAIDAGIKILDAGIEILEAKRSEIDAGIRACAQMSADVEKRLDAFKRDVRK